MSHNLLEHLNEQQLEAVTHDEGPLMIIAGAGTGKTTVITQRIAWLIEQGKAKPDEVLALTFTEKAATEMEERVDQLLPIGYVDLWISTFHSFCERILRAHALDIGIPNEFRLLNEVDAFLLVRRNLDRFNLDYYKPRGNPTRFIRALLSHFSRTKDELITSDRYHEYTQSLQMDADTSEGVATADGGEELAEIARVKEIASAYSVYQQLLLEEGALDFADLVSYTVELFKKRPEILKRYQEQFKYVLVDEFQDTNFAQYELIKLLTTEPHNVTVVGDDDQSIYQFRGASLSNILLFRDDFPKAKSVVLNKNYRSTAPILDHAYTLIQQNNPNRLESREDLNKQLEAQTNDHGLVEHVHCATVQDEVQDVIKRIMQLQSKHQCPWSDFAILVRANDHAEPFVNALDQLRIPYRFMALAGLYSKSIIIDAMAYLRVIDQPHESPAMYRLLSHPSLGISDDDITTLTMYCRRKGCSLLDAMQVGQGVSERGKRRIQEILATLSTLRTSARRKPSSELFVEMMNETGLLAGVREHEEPKQKEEFDFLNQFFQRLKKFETFARDKSLHHFLEEFEHERQAGESGALASDPETGPDVVNIMTVHASKGLEFRFVFLVHLVEQRFPSQRRSEPIALPDELANKRAVTEGDPHVEEERRLFYVAMTRAKEGLYLYSAQDYGGTRARKLSRFVNELELQPSSPEASDAFSERSESPQEAPKEPATPTSLSFTQMAAFSSCPLQYKFAHILKIPVFGRYQMSFGKTMHNTLQRFMERVKEQQLTPQASLFEQPEDEHAVELPSKNDLEQIYNECWIDEWYPDENVKSEYREKGKQSLHEYHAMLTKQLPEIAFLEKGFTLKVGGVTVRGRIDRIDKTDDGYEIIDYKTGSPKTAEKITWQDRRQLVLYTLAAEQCFDPPLQIAKLTYHYLEDNSMVSFEPTEKDREKLVDEISKTVELIKTSTFDAKPGFHCRYCDFKDICEFSAA